MSNVAKDLSAQLPSGITISDADLMVTTAAKQKLTQLVRDADDEIASIRVFVAGGGCSGMNYGMNFVPGPQELDSTISDDNGFSLVIDPVALSFLQGAEIDYVDDGVNASFVFNNVFKAVGGSGACGGCSSSGG